jgi:hypothetical protein
MSKNNINYKPMGEILQTLSETDEYSQEILKEEMIINKNQK